MSDHDHGENLARRVPALEGGVNFRDLGGYQTGDGRTVRWGQLYRSGHMSHLTPADCAVLSRLNIRAVHDLRTSDERASAPNHWAAQAGIQYWCRDYTSSFGVLRGLLAADIPTVEAAAAALRAGYRRLPSEHAPAYRALFAQLKNGNMPMVFNCSAGKDRAGTAAAIILRALGVPRATILRDYCLTDQLLNAARLGLHQTAKQDSLLASIPPEVLAIVLGTNPLYIDGAFAAIDEEYGTFANYLSVALGLDEAELHDMRDALLE